ncbi:MAG: hypothetical protein IKV13_07375, partial [Akkermansia sp.]|nr:hypothetical protein [Akkermansia sp.]
TFSGKTHSYGGFSVCKECAIPAYALEMGAQLYGRQGNTPLVLRAFSHSNVQAYRLTIAPDSIVVEGAGPAGFIYATATLLQLAAIRNDSIPKPCCRPPMSTLSYRASM